MRVLRTLPSLAAALLLFSGVIGCTGTPSSDGGLSLPSFGAPEQWEPDVEESESLSDDVDS